MTTITLLIILLAATSEAFSPLSTFSHNPTRLLSSINDEAIARLQKEYRELQDVLLQDLEQHQMAEAKEVSEEMFEKAAELTAFQKYQQEEKLEEANEHLQKAIGDLEQAQALQEQAHADAEWSQDEANMVESLEAGYEDLERLRDLSVHHAAQHLEEDARELVMEATFQELEAQAEQEDAVNLLRKLEHNERLLKDTIKQLKEEKNQQLREQKEAHEMLKHVDFVKSVRKIIQVQAH